jgi:3-oxoacyl-[acyl-carrier protein] reductase
VIAREDGTYAGKIAVVSGASRGLGKLLVEHFLAQGARVVGLSRSEATVENAAYEHLRVDVGDERSVRAAFGTVGRAHGGVDIAVNNAAVLTSVHALLMPVSSAEDMVRTNLLGSLYVAREAAKLMRRRGAGRIITIGSMAVALETIGDSIYAATKAAAITMTGVLAREWADFGITVNTLAISALETDMLRQLPRAKVDAALASLPLPRLATPDDVFNVVDFFASPRSSNVTAQTIFLGGVHG